MSVPANDLGMEVIVRRTITISVNDEMHKMIREGTRSRACSTVSEYLRLLVRRDQRSEPAVTEPSRRLRRANECIANTDRNFDL